MELSVQVVEHQETCRTLSCENNLLNKRLNKIIRQDSKGKSEGSMIQFQQEGELVKTNANMTASLDKNIVLEKEPIQVKIELEKAPKYTISL